jgi:hypothetical protein
MWVVIRHDELDAQAVVHVDALPAHRLKGWVRVSEPVADKDSLRPAEYADAPDLDAQDAGGAQDGPAPPAEQDDDKPAEKPAKTARASVKEK